MTFNVTTSKRFGADMLKLVARRVEHEADATERIIQGILGRLKSFGQNPFVGDIVQRDGDEVIRVSRYKSFRIYFSVDEMASRVHILRILHVRERDPDFLE